MLHFDEIQKEFLMEYLTLFSRGNGASGIHKHKSILEEIAFFPAHEHRKNSREYRKIHKKLVDEMDLPCMICGVRKSILNDAVNKNDPKLNPYGATQMETHHHIIEWALGNAIDIHKFNAQLLPNLRKKHPENQKYRNDFSEKELLSWIDHSEDNLWVLCDIHHRHKHFGVHAITYPVWGSQNLLKQDFEEYIIQQLLGQ